MYPFKLKNYHYNTIFQLRELNLGTHFPNINHIEIKKLTVNPNNGLIDDLELCLQLEYNGGFQLSTDANMRLNKTASVSVKGNSSNLLLVQEKFSVNNSFMKS